MISSIGSATIEGFSWLNGVYGLMARLVYWLVIGPWQGQATRSKSVVQQMIFVGLRSALIVFFVNFFTGIVLAMQSAYQLEKMGALLYVASLVAVSLCRELGPVLTALVVAGRAGSAIAAELGTMKVNEQIEAIDTMAIDPVRLLVCPRFLALLLALPVLTILGDLSGIFGGFIVGTNSLNISPDLYMQTTFKYLQIKDIYTGLIKSLVFAVIIALISCYEGINTKGGAEGVGRATTRSVVFSFILIILADCVVTGLFYFSKV